MHRTLTTSNIRSILFICCLFLSNNILSQTQQDYASWNPASAEFPVLEGQAWPKEVKNYYDRFPARAEKKVNENVWNLSKNSTGLFIKFKTNANNIQVNYTVAGKNHAFPHMPATGVSGTDLYGIDRNGKWYWFPGRYSFGDTISYRFSNLLSRDDSSKRTFEYHLYLPLYNTVTWMEIKYPRENVLTPVPLRLEKPIVVYGTSIAQGGCASRPGLAWTAFLQRNLDRPLINLGFSGNGRLDTSVIDLVTEIDAKLYVLDCLPNLTDSVKYPEAELSGRIQNAVHTIQKKRPGIPIVLSEHSAGGAGSGMNLSRNNTYDFVNRVLGTTIKKMKEEGIKNIYLLTNKEIDFNMNSTVDGVHPNDLGMEQNAVAFEKKIRQILKEPVGNQATTIPVSQSRDRFYYMPERHQEVLKYNREHKPSTVFIGNSIVHMWGGEPTSSIATGTSSWNEVFKPLETLNMGFGWDRIENVLWRVYHDELDGINPKRTVVMIGTNNIGLNTDDEIIAGLKNLYAAIRVRQPQTKIFAIGILPRTKTEKRVAALNKKIKQLANSINATYADPGKVLLDSKGITDESLFSDGLHPNEEGYRRLGEQFKKILSAS